jgi:hypothetical protein
MKMYKNHQKKGTAQALLVYYSYRRSRRYTNVLVNCTYLHTFVVVKI